jgi:O-antigen/teichoic acid export membrane protein
MKAEDDALLSAPLEAGAPAVSAASATTRSTAPRSKDSRIAVVTINNFASYGLLAGIALATSRFLGPEGRGVVVLFTTTASFTLLLSTLGTNIAGRVYLVNRDSPLKMSDYLGLALILALLNAFLCATLGFLVLAHSGALVTPWVLPLLVANSGVYLYGYMAQFGLAAFGYNNAATRSQVSYAGSQLCILIVVHAAGRLSVTTFLAIIVLTTGGQCAYACIQLARAGLYTGPTFTLSALRQHVRRSLPALMFTFFEAGAFRLDRLVVGLLLAPAAVGVYSVSATFSDLAALIPVSVGQILFSNVARGGLSPDAVRRLQKSNFLVTLGAASVLFIVGPSVIHAILGSPFDGAATPMRILLVATMATATYQVNNTVVAASGLLGRASQAAAAGCFVDLALCFVLVPMFGISGAAAASLVAYCSMAFVAWWGRIRLEATIAMRGSSLA